MSDEFQFKPEYLSKLKFNEWSALAQWYQDASMGNKSEHLLKEAFNNSRYHCFVYYKNLIVGAGRVLADGYDCTYLWDIAVKPEYQGKGIGKHIIKYLVNLSSDHNKIILYSVEGKQDFYRQCGFHPMKTAMAIFKDREKALSSGLITVNN